MERLEGCPSPGATTKLCSGGGSAVPCAPLPGSLRGEGAHRSRLITVTLERGSAGTEGTGGWHIPMGLVTAGATSHP